MSAFSQALAIAIACILSFGLVAHRVLSALVEQKFSELELSLLKSRSENLETQNDIKMLEAEIKELKILLLQRSKK